ncbi:MAG: hypothetical protein RBT62_00275 [Spirochaetia bacterium]|jgi:hypothetical protein|nr:hypothetical protein [Spirochaetia bacterium]
MPRVSVLIKFSLNLVLLLNCKGIRKEEKELRKEGVKKTRVK